MREFLIIISNKDQLIYPYLSLLFYIQYHLPEILVVGLGVDCVGVGCFGGWEDFIQG